MDMNMNQTVGGITGGGAGQREIKGGKWDNCKSIINITYLKKNQKNPTMKSKTATCMNSHVYEQSGATWALCP